MQKVSTIKLYPYFSSLSGDLLFFMAIDTIFLSTVKGMSASQIALMTALGTLICLVLQFPLLQLIKKIGNQNAIKIGTFLLFASACLYTFGEIVCAFIACAFYYLALFFIEMKVNILKNNLNNENRQDYMKIDSKSKLLFSIYTLIIIFIAPPLFNINSLIPMCFCMLFAFASFIFSFFIKDASSKDSQATIENKERKKEKVKMPKSIVLTILASILFVPLIVITSTNAKLLTQEMMLDFYELSTVVYFVSGVVLALRLARVISVFCFSKYCNKLTERSLIVMAVLLLFSILFVIGGGLIAGVIGYVFIIIGAILLFSLIDPYQLVVKNYILKNTTGFTSQKAISLNYSAINVGNLFLSLIATIILLKLPIIFALCAFAIFAVVEIIIIICLLKTIKKEKLASIKTANNFNK